MNNMSRAEQAAFNDDHNRYYAAQTRADARDAAIADEVEALLAVGGECYPYSPANLFEALGQVSDEKQATIQAFFATAHEYAGMNDLANHGFFTATRVIVKEYWDEAALVIATRNVDERLK